MATNDVGIQLQKAIEMKETVKEFAATLKQRMSDLSDMLDHFVRAGFPEDIARTYYARYYTPDNQIINDLSSKMLSDHVDFLDNVISDLTQARDRQ